MSASERAHEIGAPPQDRGRQLTETPSIGCCKSAEFDTTNAVVRLKRRGFHVHRGIDYELCGDLRFPPISEKATAVLPKIVTFRDWLLAEAASDLRQLQKEGRAAMTA
jgi:hypothetical protein